MKRLLCLLFVLFLSCSISALADSNAPSSQPTQKRGAFEFCELFMKRYMLNAENDSKGGKLFPNNSQPLIIGDSVIISTSAGTLEISLADFSVIGFSTIMSDPDASVDDEYTYMLKSIISISSLEYSNTDDLFLGANAYLDTSEETSAVANAELIFLKINNILMQREYLIRMVQNGERIKAYSGNYDYYLEYKEKTSGNSKTRLFLLIAEAR